VASEQVVNMNLIKCSQEGISIMNDSTRTLNVVWPVPGDGLPADRPCPKSRQIPDEPNPIGYPTRPYWQSLSEAGIPPPDDAKVRAVGIEPAKVWAFSDFEDRRSRSVQSTGLPRAFYSIDHEHTDPGLGSQRLPGTRRVEGKTEYARTMSGTALAELSGWDPCQDPFSRPVEDEALGLTEETEPPFDLLASLMSLPPRQREAMTRLIDGAGNWFGKVEAIALELGLARTTVSTHLARAEAKLRQALAVHEPPCRAKRRLRSSSEGQTGRV
jgi:DNA-binding CsgD family transcriptional regulator